jgi:hypothetical protein
MRQRWEPATVLRVSGIGTALLMLLFLAGNTVLIARSVCGDDANAYEEVWPQHWGDGELLVVRSVGTHDSRYTGTLPPQRRTAGQSADFDEPASGEMPGPAAIPAPFARTFGLPPTPRPRADSTGFPGSPGDTWRTLKGRFDQRLNATVPETIDLPWGFVPHFGEPGP